MGILDFLDATLGRHIWNQNIEKGAPIPGTQLDKHDMI